MTGSVQTAPTVDGPCQRHPDPGREFDAAVIARRVRSPSVFDKMSTND